MGANPFVTTPLPPSGSQFDPIVYNEPLAAATASIAATTLITALSTGTYRLSVQASTTVLGSGATTSLGKHAVNAIFTDPATSGIGTVNTSGTSVTWESGTLFDTQWTGSITINGTSYTISSVNSTTSITLTASAGTQTGVVYSFNVGSVTVTGFATFTLGSGTNYNGVLGNCPLTAGSNVLVFRALAGTAIQLSTTLTAAGGSPSPEPNIVITPVLELLSQ